MAKKYPNEDTIHTSALMDRNYDRLMNPSSKVYKDAHKSSKSAALKAKGAHIEGSRMDSKTEKARIPMAMRRK